MLTAKLGEEASFLGLRLRRWLELLLIVQTDFLKAFLWCRRFTLKSPLVDG